MGAWDVKAFNNDGACDWAYGLEEVDDLSLVESAIVEVEKSGNDYLDQEIACNALAACEVLARLKGNHGYKDSYTQIVDQWVATHPIKPLPSLIKRALTVIDRVLGNNSELAEVYDDPAIASAWRDAVADLRVRVEK